MTSHLLTGVRPYGEDATDILITDRTVAAIGPYTAVFAMANTNPVQDNAGVVEQVLRLGREAGWVDVHPVSWSRSGASAPRPAGSTCTPSAP